jgi:cyanate permease
LSASPAPLWKKFWLLFAVIWIVVSGMQAATIFLLSDEPQKGWRPLVLGIAVPALVYLVLWIWQRLRGKPAE